jgi:hypothetical protein
MPPPPTPPTRQIVTVKIANIATPNGRAIHAVIPMPFYPVDVTIRLPVHMPLRRTDGLPFPRICNAKLWFFSVGTAVCLPALRSFNLLSFNT